MDRSHATPSRPAKPGLALDRLLDAVAHVSARDGYVHLTVERLLAVAGVSRATFYQHFSNLDDCFWSAYHHHADQLVREAQSAAQGSRHRERRVLEALAAAARSRPDSARLLMREGLAAGPSGFVERDALISRIQQAMAGTTTQHATLDLPSSILVGGMFRFLSMQLSDGGVPDGVCDEVREWAGAFARRSSGDPSWSARFAPTLSRQPWGSAQSTSGVLPRGVPRERLVRATAETIREKGYRNVAVADIVAAAGVSRRSFYNIFPTKSAAFIAAYEQAFQQAVAACTPAFFTPRTWPERVWHGAQAFTSFFSREPLLAYIGFVECYAIGPDFERRVHDTQLAFTLFLEDGYRQRPEAQSLSRACSALTAAMVLELGFHGNRHGPGLNMRPLQPLAVFIALAPFIGSQAAGDFVESKLAAVGVAPSAAA